MKLYKGYIFDMDGVIYRGDTPIDGSIESTLKLMDMGKKVQFITNNSAKSARDYRDLLLNIGIAPLEDDNIITSGDVTANYLAKELKKYPEKKKVLCVAENSVRQSLTKVGMEVIDPKDYKCADYVVVGFYPSFDWKLGSQAANAIAVYGAKLIGANPDPMRPVENGEISAGTGSIVAFIECASQTKALLMGKPYPEMYNMALQRMGLTIPDVLMVGDMLTTDIKGAVDIGMDSALVLTGIATKDDVQKTGIKPTYVIDNLKDLLC